MENNSINSRENSAFKEKTLEQIRIINPLKKFNWFFHSTRVDNLDSILLNGIVSKQYANENNISYFGREPFQKSDEVCLSSIERYITIGGLFLPTYHKPNDIIVLTHLSESSKITHIEEDEVRIRGIIRPEDMFGIAVDENNTKTDQIVPIFRKVNKVLPIYSMELDLLYPIKIEALMWMQDNIENKISHNLQTLMNLSEKEIERFLIPDDVEYLKCRERYDEVCLNPQSLLTKK